jgi:transcriptional regulator with XRE-family HTH domain
VRKSLYTQESHLLLSLLRKVRQDAGLTQAQMAEKLHVHQSWVSYYERGSRKLDMLQVRKICVAAGVSLTAFSAMLDEAITEVEATP